MAASKQYRFLTGSKLVTSVAGSPGAAGQPSQRLKSRQHWLWPGSAEVHDPAARNGLFRSVRLNSHLEDSHSVGERRPVGIPLADVRWAAMRPRSRRCRSTWMPAGAAANRRRCNRAGHHVPIGNPRRHPWTSSIRYRSNVSALASPGSNRDERVTILDASPVFAGTVWYVS